MNAPCKICEKKRARRYCPGVSGEICPSCCATGREETIDCPSDCEHLVASRKFEQLAPMDPANLPNQDIKLSEEFIREHDREFLWLAASLVQAMERERAVDLDAREALDALVRTYRTRESGLIYETRPQNPYAASIQAALAAAIEELGKHLAEDSGMHTLRDADILGTLVFLQRLERSRGNGRRRGRAFLHFLRANFPAEPLHPLAPLPPLSAGL
ncbi:MAG: hypothetical protein ACRD30_08510 [Bryobacteraceae bacterium]